MRQRSIWVSVSLCLLLLFAASGEIANALGPPEENRSSSASVPQSPRLSSSLGATENLNPIYLGTFTCKGKFQADTVLGRLNESLDDDPQTFNRDRDVPTWLLTSSERLIKDSDTGAHTVEVANPHSRLWGLVHPVVSAVYGSATVLRNPTYIATDSQHRLIVTDASDNSVHVLDPAGKDSFRIVAGPRYRLKHPEGVATDKEGNIYIADSVTSLVLEYDSLGRFVRHLGVYVDEPMFYHPTAIAIDQRRSLLYVADGTANLVSVLDLLTGRELRQFGKGHNGLGVPDLHHPLAVAVNERSIGILDAGGKRIYLLDTEGHVMAKLPIAQYGTSRDKWSSIAFDGGGNLYATTLVTSRVMLLSHTGEFINSFGQAGTAPGQFYQPQGLSSDAQNVLYVADSSNARVQVFQFPANVNHDVGK